MIYMEMRRAILDSVVVVPETKGVPISQVVDRDRMDLTSGLMDGKVWVVKEVQSHYLSLLVDLAARAHMVSV